MFLIETAQPHAAGRLYFDDLAICKLFLSEIYISILTVKKEKTIQILSTLDKCSGQDSWCFAPHHHQKLCVFVVALHVKQ